MAAEVEEIFVDPDVAALEHFPPDLRQGVLLRRPRCDGVAFALLSAGDLGHRQGRAVELAVGGEGQLVEEHEVCGHHVLGQTIREEGAHLGQHSAGEPAAQRAVGVGAPGAVEVEGRAGWGPPRSGGAAAPEQGMKRALRPVCRPAQGQLVPRVAGQLVEGVGIDPVLRQRLEVCPQGLGRGRALRIAQRFKQSARAGQPGVGQIFQGEVVGTFPAQGAAQAGLIPTAPPAEGFGHLRRVAVCVCVCVCGSVHPQDRLVAVAVELIVVPAALGHDLDGQRAFHPPCQDIEEGGVDEQLVLLQQSARRVLAQLLAGSLATGLLKGDLGAKHFQ